MPVLLTFSFYERTRRWY